MRLSYCYKVIFGLACGILCLYAFDLFFRVIHLVFNKRYLKMPKVRLNILENVSYIMVHNLSQGLQNVLFFFSREIPEPLGCQVEMVLQGCG